MNVKRKCFVPKLSYKCLPILLHALRSKTCITDTNSKKFASFNNNKYRKKSCFKKGEVGGGN